MVAFGFPVLSWLENRGGGRQKEVINHRTMHVGLNCRHPSGVKKGAAPGVHFGCTAIASGSSLEGWQAAEPSLLWRSAQAHHQEPMLSREPKGVMVSTARPK